MSCEDDVSTCAGPLQACVTTADCCAGLDCSSDGVCTIF
jgi:hypothetical protein